MELWDILSECRKIVKQARGKDTANDGENWLDMKERGINYRGGLGAAVVGTLVDYRQHEISKNGGRIDLRVYNKVVEFIDFVQSAMNLEEYTRPEWRIKDEWHNYYEQTIHSAQDFGERLRRKSRIALGISISVSWKS